MDIKEELKGIKRRINEIESSLDDSQPELTAEWWAGFDWGFFGLYGGLPVVPIRDCDEYCDTHIQSKADMSSDFCYELRESPLYPWSGGECPVPDNVEVKITRRDDITYTGAASEFKEWRRRSKSHNSDIIAFRLTGKLCD